MFSICMFHYHIQVNISEIECFILPTNLICYFPQLWSGLKHTIKIFYFWAWRISSSLTPQPGLSNFVVCVCAPTSNFFIITKQCDKLHHIYLIVSVSDFNLIPPSFSQISLKHNWPDLELKEREQTHPKGLHVLLVLVSKCKLIMFKKQKG